MKRLREGSSFKNEMLQNPSQEEMFCKLCGKHFNTANSFANHLNSKKHKELCEAAAAASSLGGESKDTYEEFAIKSDRSLKREQQQQQAVAAAGAAQKADESIVEVMEGDEKDWEDMDDEEMDTFGNLFKEKRIFFRV